MKLFLILSLLLVHPVSSQEEGQPVDPDVDSNESQYNSTYAESMSKLHQAMFRNYNKNIRPVAQADSAVDVDLAVSVSHVSFDQLEQTMTVHGHLYMGWVDEYLHWDPKDYDGVATTNAHKWQIWMPELRVTNSINGIYSAHDISRSAHITVSTISTDGGATYTKAQVSTYPTFSIRVGCLMDFSEYPNDEHSCNVRIFTPKKMREVRLRVYANQPPIMFDSMANQTGMRSSGDFTILDGTNNISYYRYAEADGSTPVTGIDTAKAWTIYNLYIQYKRHSANYVVTVMIPIITASFISLSSLLIRELHFATIVNAATFVLHLLFVTEFKRICPLSVFEVPRAMRLHGWSMCLTILIFLVHITLNCIGSLPKVQNMLIDGYSKAYSALPFTPYPGFMSDFVKELGDIRTRGWLRNVFIWRAVIYCFLSTLYFILVSWMFLI